MADVRVKGEYAPGGCACPSQCAYSCVRIRYNLMADDSVDDPCECACHYYDSEEENHDG